jgi:hypothetical protein
MSRLHYYAHLLLQFTQSMAKGSIHRSDLYSVCEGHTKLAKHQVIADELTTFIKRKMKWY